MKTNSFWLAAAVFLALLSGQSASKSDKKIITSADFP